MKKVLLAAVFVLVAAPSANAGCFASVKLSSLPSGKVWNVRVTPLQHGRTRLPDAKPRIEIRNGSGRWIVFRARKTKTTGTFAVTVRFPSAGRWQLRIWDGFEPHCARYHTYAPVTVGV